MLAVFAAALGINTAYFLKHDPALVRRRLAVGPTAETEPTQKTIQTVTSLLLLAILILSALDWRFGWSGRPAAIWALVGEALILLGFAVIFVVFRTNSFTAATVRVAGDQPLVDTGPYALVRHPMYAGAVPMMIGMPLALGSWWGLVPSAFMIAALAWRLTDEERVLVAELPGYEDYRSRVRWRLCPGLY